MGEHLPFAHVVSKDTMAENKSSVRKLHLLFLCSSHLHTIRFPPKKNVSASLQFISESCKHQFKLFPSAATSRHAMP